MKYNHKRVTLVSGYTAIVQHEGKVRGANTYAQHSMRYINELAYFLDP